MEQQETSTNPTGTSSPSANQSPEQIQQSSHRTDNTSTRIQETPTITKSSPERITNNQIDSTQEIVQEEEEEDWEHSQFQEIDFNNIREGECIRQEYSAQFVKESNKETSYKQVSFQDTEPKTVCYLPEPEYYNMGTRPKPGTRYQNPNVYLPPPPDPRDIEHWYGRKGRGQDHRLQLHGHTLFGEKTHSVENCICRKRRKNLRQ